MWGEVGRASVRQVWEFLVEQYGAATVVASMVSVVSAVVALGGCAAVSLRAWGRREHERAQSRPVRYAQGRVPVGRGRAPGRRGTVYATRCVSDPTVPLRVGSDGARPVELDTTREFGT